MPSALSLIVSVVILTALLAAAVIACLLVGQSWRDVHRRGKERLERARFAAAQQLSRDAIDRTGGR